MRYSDINKMFTDKVGEYIAKGYVINTGTMSGTQGEIAKVDLTDGDEVIRVSLRKIYTRGHDGIEFSVGKAARGNYKINIYDSFNTIWNDDIDQILNERYYHADYSGYADWFVSYEEACNNAILALQRTGDRMIYAKPVPDKAKDIILAYVRHKPGCSRARKESITVDKVNGHYRIYYRNREWRLA